MKPLFAALAALIAMPASGQVYKCKEGGTTVFSAQPCGAGSQAIDAMHDEHSTRQAQLRAKKTRANNNLAGATWEQSISDEMQAVAAEYDMKLRKATKELDELKMQRSQIP